MIISTGAGPSSPWLLMSALLSLLLSLGVFVKHAHASINFESTVKSFPGLYSYYRFNDTSGSGGPCAATVGSPGVFGATPRTSIPGTVVQDPNTALDLFDTIVTIPGPTFTAATPFAFCFYVNLESNDSGDMLMKINGNDRVGTGSMSILIRALVR